MLGFVSALSASVSVMILLMAVLLANVMSSAMEMEENKYKAKIDGIEDKSKKNKKNEVNAVMKSLTFDHQVINIMQDQKAKEIELHCTYGNNLTLDTALTYTVYNTIYLKRNIPEITIKALNPIEDNNAVNSCFFKSRNNEKK